MRLLFVSGLTGFASGGVVTEMIRLIGGTRDRGIDVAFAIDRLPGPLSDVRHFPIDYPPSANAAAQFRSAVDAFQPDAVHVIGGGLSILRPVDAWCVRTPWVFTAHNVPPFERISGRFPGNNRLHYLVRNARALISVVAWKRFLRTGGFSSVIAHGQSVGQSLTAYGCPASKIVLIPFGVEADQIPPPGNDGGFPADAYPKILTVAGYAHHKGIHDYLAAVARLTRRFPMLAYHVIGDARNKQYTQFLRARIDELGLNDRVILLPRAGDEVKRNALAAADLYVQPSHEEGFCLAFAEAAMVAPRLIGCRTGEIAGLAANDHTARVINPQDISGLATATSDLMLVHVTPADIAARVRRLQARYSWPSYLSQHMDLFADMQT